MSVDLSSVMILLGLQVGALAWRVSREIDGREKHPFPWVPVPDNVNAASMLAVLYFCLLAPLTTTGLRLYSVSVMGRAVFVAAVVLVVVHPLVIASHYRLWAGRRGGETTPLPYCTAQEAVVQVAALIIAAAAFVWVLQAAAEPTVVLTPNG